MAIPLLPIITIVGGLLDKIIPDKDAAAKAKAELMILSHTQDFQLGLQQIMVNMEEAKHPSLLVAGWRPWIGWVCGMSFTWAFVIQPFVVFIIYVWKPHLIPAIKQLPELDLATMMPVLLGMLGLGMMRTREKEKGVARESIKASKVLPSVFPDGD